MEYRALGPLTVEADGRSLKLGGPRQRMVLATLLSRANHTISQDALIEAVWASDPPEAARSTLQSYIYSLRRELGSEAIVRQGDGYRVEVDAGSFDALAFEELVEKGRLLLEEDPSAARSVLTQALSLWFGNPYGGLDDNPALLGETARLGELRLVAVEARIDSELAAGNHSAVVGELETLIREYPLREHFRGQHMIALYRSGRQAEALRAYQQARNHLVEELGIEPSAELRDLEQRILDQDPELRPEVSGEMVHRAFLFTDVEDSTLLWDIHAGQAQATIDLQDEIITRAAVHHGGTVFKRTGDGLYAQFMRVKDAVAAATAAQEELAATDWGEAPAAKVRMAAVSGEVEMRGDDYFGPVLHKAARVLAMGHGGQVLVTDEIAAGTDDLATRPLGEHRLRGVGLPENLHQLVIPGLPQDFPALRTDRAGSRLLGDGDGRTVRGYELRQPLGKGDFGVVYRAFQPSLGREVAVKLIRPEYANGVAFVRRFEREAQLVAQLEHPNILPLFDFWRDPDGAYLVMPVMQGGSLAAALTRGGWNLAPALQLLNQVGAALAYAHRKGVIHRDVKPGNVLLDEEGNAYLSDFGIATRLTDHADTPVTTSLGFVPPEELAGERHTFRSDVFSLGVLTFHLLTGVAPSGRLPLPGLDEARPGLPPELAAAVARATAEQPSERFEKVEDFLRAVRQAVGADVVTIDGDAESSRSNETTRNPYKGLRAFGETDAIDFHGRAALVDELLEAVASHNLVAVVGPSGGGKSSVVRAGLIPALRAGGLPGSRQWLFTDMYPGSYPFEELEAALLRVAVDHPSDLLTELLEPHGLLRVTKRILPGDDSTLFIVIDQFEELFSAVQSEATRRGFLDNLTAVATDERSRVRIVLTMRADFLNRPLDYGEFAEVIGAGMVTVGRPAREGLAQAVAAPARAVGVDLDAGLVGRIVADVENQPGGLPLLQYALTEMFSRREGERLTVAGYEATGGVLGALGRRAEEIYTGLPDSGQEAVRQLFLRLVTVDETAADTRRRARQRELKSLDVDQDALAEALRSYGAFRLLSFDRDSVSRGPTVEVAHEALLSEWSRLRGWIDDQRESLLLARRLSTSTTEWLESGRDPSFLLLGTRLEQTEAWRQTATVAITAEEDEFLAASIEQQKADEAAARRRRRRTILALTAGFIVVAILATVALIQREVAQKEARDARARELAGESRLALEEDTELAMLVALEAMEVSRRVGEPPVPEAIGALHTAVQTSRVIHRIGDLPERGDLATGPNGDWLVVGVANPSNHGATPDLQVIDRTGRVQAVLPGPDGARPMEIAVAPDGGVVAAAYEVAGDAETGEDPTPSTHIVLFDPTDGSEAGRLPWPKNADFVLWLHFSPDGGRLAASSPNTVLVWDLSTGETAAALEVDFREARMRAPAAFWSDNDTLVYPNENGDLVWYSVPEGVELDSWPMGDVATIYGISADRSRIAVGTDQRLGVYDLDTGNRLVDVPIGPSFAFDWSPDGTRLAFSGYDPLIYVVDAATGETLLTLAGSDDNVFAVEFLTDDLLANIDADELLVWDVSATGPSELGSVRPLSGPAWSYRISDERVVALTDSGESFELIDTATGAQLAALPNQVVSVQGGARVASPDLSLVGSLDNRDYRSTIHRLPSMELVAEFDPCRSPITFSPDNRLVVLTGDICGSVTQGIAEVVEIRTGRTVLELPHPVAWSAEFNPAGDFAAGRYLALTNQSTVWIYDMESASLVREIPDTAIGGAGVLVLSFDARGRYLVGGTVQGRVWVIDMRQLVDGATLEESLVFNKEAHTGAAPAPAVTSDGLVASASFDGLVRLWDIHTDELVVEFRADVDTPVVRFSPDETFLWYPDSGNLARFYLDPGKLVELAQSRLTRDMTPDECLRYREPAACAA